MSSKIGAIAAGHKLTAEAGAIILEEGGNAFDAAIASAFMATFCEPILASPGGGGFLMALDNKSSQTYLFDFFAQTPKRKLPEREIDFQPIFAHFGTVSQEFHIGSGTSAAPGFIKGLFEIHRKLGSLPMTEIVEPVVKYAKDGIKINSYQALLTNITEAIIATKPCSAKQFKPCGELLKEGDFYKNPSLSEFYYVLAREGERFFTHGEVSDIIIENMKTHGGHLTYDDLRDYKTIIRKPLQISFSDYKIYLNPPPSAGGSLVALSIIIYNILRKIDATKPIEFDIATALDHTYNLRRALKSGFDKYLAKIQKTADFKKTLSEIEDINHKAKSYRGTTQISVVDKNKNAASLTISNGEGNGYFLDGLGFHMNNMLGEEDINPNGFHKWHEDERMSSMMSPTIMLDSFENITALGSGGSNRIRTALSQSLILLMQGQSIEDAILKPRIHIEKGHLDFEDFFSSEITDHFKNNFKDHTIWPDKSMYFGGVHIARILNTGGFETYADNRRAGHYVIV